MQASNNFIYPQNDKANNGVALQNKEMWNKVTTVDRSDNKLQIYSGLIQRMGRDSTF